MLSSGLPDNPPSDHSPSRLEMEAQDDSKSASTTHEGDIIKEDYAYVLKRHGRIDLDPMPSDAPDDPLNWPSWRKNILLCIVSVHAMQGPFSAAVTIPGFYDLSQEFNVSINTAAYITSVPIAFLSVMPLIWSPIAERIGRRPVYLISALISAACALAGAFCNSYGTLMATRIIQASFISPGLTIGASTVQDMFFSYQKGQKMGIWVMMVTVGPPLGPLIVGYLVQKRSWRDTLYLLAALHLGLFFAHLLLGPETMYLNRKRPGQGTSEKEELPSSSWRRQYINFQIYNRKPIHPIEFIRPLFMAVRPVMILSVFGNALNFAYTSVLMTVFVPQLFGEVFDLTAGQIGLQFIALLLGALLGESVAGMGSDFYMNWRAKRAGRRVPEYRLGFAYPGFIVSVVGVVVWGVQLQNAKHGVWNVTPDIGSAIATFGQQVVSTVCGTYSIESYITETADASAFVSFFRQMWAFLAPFYLGRAFTNLGFANAAGLLSGLMGVGMFMVLSCHIWGQRWRGVSSN